MHPSPLISVIVPVYNVEEYLDACVASIVNQSHQNLEILLVDDGSTDHSGEICDAWQARDGRIRVIHQPNGGLSDARNTGLKRASGEFIGFVDSDDFIAPDMYEALLERLCADGSDICVGGFISFRGDMQTPEPMENCMLSTSEAMHALLRARSLTDCVWNKLYRKDVVQGIPFPVGKYYEDVFWLYQVIAHAQKVSIIDTCCYFYRKRTGSITMQPYSPKQLHYIEAHLQRLDFLQAHFPELELLEQRRLICACMSHAPRSAKYLKGSERRAAFALLKTAFLRSLRPRGEINRRRPVRHFLCLWGSVFSKMLRVLFRRLRSIRT